MDVDDFLDGFLEHRSEYDPVKAREYYLRTRKLKGKASAGDKAKAAEYKDYQTATAEGEVLKKVAKSGVTMNKKRRIGAAEQKLIRAKSIANAIKDPIVKADVLKKIRSTEGKLNKVKAKKTKSTLTRAKLDRPIKVAAKPKPVVKRVGKLEVLTYPDGSTVTYDGNKEVGTTPPTKNPASKKK